jgi:probable phosphoglycerate mutase
VRIVFVRHGEPDYVRDTLTDTGRPQAEAAAIRLRDEGIEEIWSSPMGRAYETAQATADVLGLPVRTLDFMHELDWGSIDDEPIFADGHPWDIADEMARQGMPLNSPDWRENPFFVRNRVLRTVDLVEKGIDEWLAGYGYIRNGAYYDHDHREEKHGTVALFSHGGSSAAALGHILDLPFPYACGLFHIAFTGITIVRMDWRAGHCTLPCLELANDGGHLRGI